MSEISKKDRFTVPAVICLICNVLLFIHLCGAGAYAGGNLHYEAANTQMERNEEFFHQFFLSNHLMGIAETLAMVAALIALLMVIHVWWTRMNWWLTADSPPTGMKCRCTISVGLRPRPC